MKNFSATDCSVPSYQPAEDAFIVPGFIQADVVFGSPREDCAGTGICRIEAHGLAPAAAAGPRECRRARAILNAPDARTLELVFQQTDLCAHLYRHYFRQNRFQLTENCPLPALLVQSLHLAGDELLAGTYPLRRRDGFYHLALPV